jgi:hypothetical protein
MPHSSTKYPIIPVLLTSYNSEIKYQFGKKTFDRCGISPYNSCMREWKLKSGDPLALTLAADARLGPTNYFDDQIWELALEGGEPPALNLRTNYGLRARSMRIFPRFTEGDLSRSEPEAFAQQPVVHKISPCYISLSYSPFTGIEISADYWVIDSGAVLGRMKLENISQTSRLIRLDMVGLLSPDKNGHTMKPDTMGSIEVLVGKSGNLFPVLHLAGGATSGSGPFPSLTLTFNLHPGHLNQVTWIHAAKTSVEESFESIKEILERNLEAEFARVHLINSGDIEVFTGDPDWDAAFAFSQKTASQLLMGPTSHLPHLSYVYSREPENGYTLRGDGKDYNHLWTGQSPLETWYLTNIILPSASQIAQGFLANFLASAREDGFVDWKPGLAGQRSSLLATPILASLTETIYQSCEDINFWENNLPGLLAFFQAWFTPEQDRDGDGIPEWTHPMQSGFEDHPLFSNWQSGSQGADISVVENPALCSFLFRECCTLIRMAELLNYQEPLTSLRALADNLRAAVEISWDTEFSIYRNWDRDSHYCSPSEKLGELAGPGRINLDLNFEHPVRLLITVKNPDDDISRPQIFIHGLAPNGQHLVERIQSERFHWNHGVGFATGGKVYSKLEFVVIENIAENTLVGLETINYLCDEQSLLLPLWAGIPAEERVQDLIKNTITSPNKFWKRYGISACGSDSCDTDFVGCSHIHLPWNVLIGEGLLHYGYRVEAAALLSRVMSAIIQTLKVERNFRQYYHADSGQGIGEQNHVTGLAPLGFFLETLGVRMLSSQKVGLSGFNPFPWPVTVKYRGMTILRQKDKTIVTFPDGQLTTINDSSPCIVYLE